jgi:hypothetical protein
LNNQQLWRRAFSWPYPPLFLACLPHSMLGEGISIPFDGYGDCLICFLEKKPELRGYKWTFEANFLGVRDCQDSCKLSKLFTSGVMLSIICSTLTYLQAIAKRSWKWPPPGVCLCNNGIRQRGAGSDWRPWWRRVSSVFWLVCLLFQTTLTYG